MGQTSESAKRVRDALLAKDPDYYKKIGASGGKKGGFKGLALVSEKKRVRIASLGGVAAKKQRKRIKKGLSNYGVRRAKEAFRESKSGAQQAPSPSDRN